MVKTSLNSEVKTIKNSIIYIYSPVIIHFLFLFPAPLPSPPIPSPLLSSIPLSVPPSLPLPVSQ